MALRKVNILEGDTSDWKRNQARDLRSDNPTRVHVTFGHGFDDLRIKRN